MTDRRQPSSREIIRKKVVYKLQYRIFEIKQTETFRKWRTQIKDPRVRGLIASRLDRLSFGHTGDAEPVGHGISELRIHFGSGYRIYFHKRSDKSSQAKDIATAKRLASDWSE